MYLYVKYSSDDDEGGAESRTAGLRPRQGRAQMADASSLAGDACSGGAGG